MCELDDAVQARLRATSAGTVVPPRPRLLPSVRGPTAEVFAGDAAFTDRINNAFTLDLVFHLSERRHDRE